MLSQYTRVGYISRCDMSQLHPVSKTQNWPHWSQYLTIFHTSKHGMLLMDSILVSAAKRSRSVDPQLKESARRCHFKGTTRSLPQSRTRKWPHWSQYWTIFHTSKHAMLLLDNVEEETCTTKDDFHVVPRI